MLESQETLRHGTGEGTIVFPGLLCNGTGPVWPQGPETPWLLWVSCFMPAPIANEAPPGMRSPSLRPVYWNHRMIFRNSSERKFCDCGMSQNTLVTGWRITFLLRGTLIDRHSKVYDTTGIHFLLWPSQTGKQRLKNAAIKKPWERAR